MSKQRWHWIKDNDFPSDGQEVWCVNKGLNNCLFRYPVHYSKDLNSINEYDFPRKNQKGFYDYDSECGYYEISNVICWTEIQLPELPEELKKEYNYEW